MSDQKTGEEPWDKATPSSHSPPLPISSFLIQVTLVLMQEPEIKRKLCVCVEGGVASAKHEAQTQILDMLQT